ncbi:g7008 [Coccomyxa elongata]
MFSAPLPPDVSKRLQRIVDSVPDLGPESRVMDAREQYGTSSSLGNDPGMRTWVGDVESVPAYQGPFDAAFFNAVFGNVYDQRETLLRAALLLRPGGHIVVSHPEGKAWHERLHAEDPEMVPHVLPDEPELQRLTADLPLRIRSFQNNRNLYLALLQVPPAYLIQGRPLELEGEVVAGFGRGSSKMGVPTANIAPGPLAAKLEGLPLGVYFGWAQLDAGTDEPEEDSEVHKMAMNIGRRPSIEDGTDVTVEVHILHSFAAADFRSKRLRVVVGGFIRPEMRFGSLDELIARIKADVGIAKAQLDLPEHQLCKAHEMFVRNR